MSLESSLRRTGMWVLTAVATAAAAAHAQRDTFVGRVNALYSAVPPSKHSDRVLLPALAAMEAPPRAVGTVEEAALLPASATGFAEAAAWAQGAPQQAVLGVLRDITKETDWTKAFVFAQPYGADDVEPAMVRARLYTELGDPPTLAAAQHLYMPALDRMACLVNVEATRLASAGQAPEAAQLLTRWVFFGRQFAGRAFAREAVWGLRAMAQGLERLRDVAYLDMQGPRSINSEALRSLLDLLAENGYSDLTRMALPPGDRIAAEQVLARVYRGHTVDERVFAPTMARLGSADRPLRLFAEASRWRSAASAQVDAPTAQQYLTGLFADWTARWQADWFDRRQSIKSEYEQLPRQSAAALTQSVPDFADVIQMRQIVRTELVGTRASLALIGHSYTFGSMATQLSAVRPLWLRSMEVDPFNPDRVNGPNAWVKYLVPMRDTPKNERGEPVPYEIAVVTSDPANPLTRRLTDDTFMVLSMGSNGKFEYGKLIQNTAKTLDRPADYLIFPPVLSLHRQVLIDGQIIK